jgi:hypothetical protein
MTFISYYTYNIVWPSDFGTSKYFCLNCGKNSKIKLQKYVFLYFKQFLAKITFLVQKSKEFTIEGQTFFFFLK